MGSASPAQPHGSSGTRPGERTVPLLRPEEPSEGNAFFLAVVLPASRDSPGGGLEARQQPEEAAGSPEVLPEGGGTQEQKSSAPGGAERPTCGQLQAQRAPPHGRQFWFIAPQTPPG